MKRRREAREKMRRVESAIAICATGIFCCSMHLAPRLAHAHATYSATLSNRYVKVSLVGEGRVRIAYAIMIGEAPATAERARADLDGNGVLDDKEVAAWSVQTAAAVARGLKVDVDGEARAPAWDQPVPGISDLRVGPIPFSLDLVGTVRVAGSGPHTIKLDDETPLAFLGETEVRIEEGPGTRVMSAWRGLDDGTRQLRFLWNGPKTSPAEDRSVGFRFVDEHAPRLAHRRPLPLSLIGAVLGALVAAYLMRRDRRRRRAK